MDTPAQDTPERLLFLTETMRLFAESTTNYEQLVLVVARRIAELLKNTCTVKVLSSDDTVVVPVAVYATDPAIEDRIRAVLATSPIRVDGHALYRRVLETGRGVLVPRVERQHLDSVSSPHAEVMASHATHTGLVVPLRTQGRSFGILTVGRYDPELPAFDERDLDFAQALADEAALAMSNARMFQALERELEERARAEATIRALEAQREADAKFRGLLEAAPDAMVIVDREGKITLVNRRAETLFGYSREELVGQTVEQLVPDAARGAHTAHRRRFFGEPKVREIGAGLDLRARRKDGTDFPVEISLSPLDTKDGRLVTSAIRDVTDRKRVEQELRDARDEAEAANRELEAFSYSVAHDLRAPLRAIHGFSAALVEDHASRLDGEAKDFLLRIEVGAERMGQLIDALLGLSRLTRTPVTRTRVNLTDLVLSVVQHLRGNDPERVLSVEVQAGLGCHGDPGLLRALMDNLLGNAWKFTARRDRGKIEVGFDASAEAPAFFVRDNGAGFDMAHAKKLFAPFQRLHKESEFAGTGIGLATVQRIVRRHGGRIWATAVVGEGATFYFTLDEH